jgi:hypothetical protein
VGTVSELILGALSLLLGYMVIRFVMALLRKRALPSDHVIAWSLMGVVFSAALIVLVGFAYGANATDWWAMCKPQPQCRQWQAAEQALRGRGCIDLLGWHNEDCRDRVRGRPRPRTPFYVDPCSGLDGCIR